jgi:hypothetical protein
VGRGSARKWDTTIFQSFPMFRKHKNPMGVQKTHRCTSSTEDHVRRLKSSQDRKESVGQLTNGFVWWYFSRNCRAEGIIDASSTTEVCVVNASEIGGRKLY